MEDLDLQAGERILGHPKIRWTALGVALALAATPAFGQKSIRIPEIKTDPKIERPPKDKEDDFWDEKSLREQYRR